MNCRNQPKKRSLKVGIDFHVVDGKFQGSRSHVIELFSRVIAISPEIEFFLFLDKLELLPQISPAFAAENVHAIRMAAADPLRRYYWQLPMLARRCELDVIHTQYVLPWPVACKRVVTIHDILFDSNPEYFTPIFVARSRILMRRAARHADHVFTVSNFSRGEICRAFAVPEQKVSVIHNGADFHRFASPDREDGAILERRGLSREGYILSVGRLEPRKNHEGLIRAYALLDKSAPPLILVGQRDFRFEGVFRAIRELGLGDRVHVFGDVQDAELPALYRNAVVFAFPTFAEGFGMPAVEAMAAGTPVLTSNAGALTELVGPGGAEIIDPHNIEDIAAALRTLLSDPALRARLGAAGRERARQFSWESSAKILHDYYLSLSG